MGLEAPAGYRYNTAGLLYDEVTKKIVGAANAAALGVPHFDPSSKRPKKTKKGQQERPKVVASLEAPDDRLSAGRPKPVKGDEPDEDVDRPKPPPPTAAARKKEDEGDLVSLIQASGGFAAAATGFTPFQVSDEDAGTIARPAARILARHKAIEKAIRKYSDPVALVVATSQVVLPKLIMFRQWQAAGSPPLDQHGRVVGAPPPPAAAPTAAAPPPPPGTPAQAPAPPPAGPPAGPRLQGASAIAESVRATAG